MGGVRRRRGMRLVAEARGSGCVLVPFVYSFADVEDARFLVEAGGDVLRVFSVDGVCVARFESGVDGCVEFWLDGEGLRWTQINAVLLLTCQQNAPLALRFEGEDGWSLEPWAFDHVPWRYEQERRDFPIVVTARPGVAGTVYEVAFDEEEAVDEADVGGEDLLRASFWVGQQEAAARGYDLRQGVQAVSQVPVSAAFGERFAVHGEDTVRYYICKKEFPGDVYVAGLDEPSCYPDNFEEAENIAGFESVTPVYSVHQVNGGGTIYKGRKVAIKSGYWEFFTCVRDFSQADYVEGCSGFADYSGFFVPGLAVGEALPCRGKWEFFCSGLWYGSYEVRRNFESSSLRSAEWESAGLSFSRLSGASNTEIAGDESGEECYLRLFLTRSKYMSAALEAGWPPDSCGNRLIVEGYRHDMELRCLPLEDGVEWRCVDKVLVPWLGRKEVRDWSWQAFSERYGFPLLSAVYNMRLVFASTLEQPQSVWMSRTDDLGNFALGDADDAAIALTMATTTQNPICWMQAQRNRLMLGTCEAEWAIVPGSESAGISPTSKVLSDYGRRGSEGLAALEADDKVLYIERGGGRCMEYGYSIEVDGYRSKDLTVLAPHVLADHGGVRQMTLVRKPDVVAVMALADGQVALCTYNAFHEVNAWHRWVTDGRVLSVCALPDGTSADRLFLLVERGGRVFVEAVDGESPYVDNGGRDYESVLVTNALGNVLESEVRRAPKREVAVLFGAECRTEALSVCADGGEWTQPAMARRVVPQGWHKLLVLNSWEFEHAVGLRYRGESGCHVLALQG